MAYSDLLKDPRWQKKRLEIFQRDEWRCFECGAEDKTLHCHHKKYETGKLPWEYPDDNFLTLCEQCHENEEWLKDDAAIEWCYQRWGCRDTRRQLLRIIKWMTFAYMSDGPIAKELLVVFEKWTDSDEVKEVQKQDNGQEVH